MGQCASYVICPAFRKDGRDRYNYLPSQNWRFTDEKLLSELQGNNHSEQESENLDEEPTNHPESSGLLEPTDVKSSLDSLDHLTMDDGIEQEGFEVEGIHTPDEELHNDPTTTEIPV
eukprot:m.309241 g.309241  ORF g.309241 m.309241 type:complete len:117 (+) comp45857_c0_seq1:47-397(+)